MDSEDSDRLVVGFCKGAGGGEESVYKSEVEQLGYDFRSGPICFGIKFH